jgi:hypothetical protein
MEECVETGAQTPKLSLTVKISNWDWVLKKRGKSLTRLTPTETPVTTDMFAEDTGDESSESLKDTPAFPLS